MYTPDRPINPPEFYSKQQPEHEEEQCAVCFDRLHVDDLNRLGIEYPKYKLKSSALVCEYCKCEIEIETTVNNILNLTK